jgi:hypothetical protein
MEVIEWQQKKPSRTRKEVRPSCMSDMLAFWIFSSHNSAPLQSVPDTNSSRPSLTRPSHARTEYNLLRQFIRPVLPPIVNRNASAMFDLVRMSGVRSSMSVERRTASLGNSDTDIDDGFENVFGFLGPERVSVPPPRAVDQNSNVRVRVAVRSQEKLDEDIRRWVEVRGIRYKVCASYKCGHQSVDSDVITKPGDYALVDPKQLEANDMWQASFDLQATHSINALGNTHRYVWMDLTLRAQSDIHS